MELDKDFELLFGGGFVLGGYEFRQLIGRAEMVRAVKVKGEGILGSESMVETFLLRGPVEELRGEIWVGLGFEDFDNEVQSDVMEFVEVGDDGRAPVVLFLQNELVMYQVIRERQMREVWVVPVLVLRVSVVVGECCGSRRLKGWGLGLGLGLWREIN